MGRKKIYKTEEEKKLANARNQRRFYQKNKEKLRETRMEKYYEDKKMETKLSKV
jgi:hypothetical protein